MKPILLYIFIGIITVSCKKSDELENNIEQINMNIKIERFDKLFNEVSANKLPELKAEYPFMFPKKYSDSFWLAKKRDTLEVQLCQEVSKTFSNFSETENEIKSVLKHVKHYFPELRTPRIITTTSDVDYRNKVIVTDTIVLISLDTYLGSNHEFYSGIPRFITANLTKSQLAVDLAEGYAKLFIYQPVRKTLLDDMIYFGKQLYLKDLIVPFKTEAERIGYTEEDLKWAINNESQIWRYLVSHEFLFSTDAKLPSRFISPAPFTKFYLEEIDSDSPGRLGQYIGWQIVRAYMKQNDVPLRDMLSKTPEEIFNNSKFKPRK